MSFRECGLNYTANHRANARIYRAAAKLVDICRLLANGLVCILGNLTRCLDNKTSSLACRLRWRAA